MKKVILSMLIVIGMVFASSKLTAEPCFTSAEMEGGGWYVTIYDNGYGVGNWTNMHAVTTVDMIWVMSGGRNSCCLEMD